MKMNTKHVTHRIHRIRAVAALLIACLLGQSFFIPWQGNVEAAGAGTRTNFNPEISKPTTTWRERLKPTPSFSVVPSFGNGSLSLNLPTFNPNNYSAFSFFNQNTDAKANKNTNNYTIDYYKPKPRVVPNNLFNFTSSLNFNSTLYTPIKTEETFNGLTKKQISEAFGRSICPSNFDRWFENLSDSQWASVSSLIKCSAATPFEAIVNVKPEEIGFDSLSRINFADPTFKRLNPAFLGIDSFTSDKINSASTANLNNYLQTSCVKTNTCSALAALSNVVNKATGGAGSSNVTAGNTGVNAIVVPKNTKQCEIASSVLPECGLGLGKTSPNGSVTVAQATVPEETSTTTENSSNTQKIKTFVEAQRCLQKRSISARLNCYYENRTKIDEIYSSPLEGNPNCSDGLASLGEVCRQYSEVKDQLNECSPDTPINCPTDLTTPSENVIRMVRDFKEKCGKDLDTFRKYPECPTSIEAYCPDGASSSEYYAVNPGLKHNATPICVQAKSFRDAKPADPTNLKKGFDAAEVALWTGAGTGVVKLITNLFDKKAQKQDAVDVAKATAEIEQAKASKVQAELAAAESAQKLEALKNPTKTETKTETISNPDEISSQSPEPSPKTNTPKTDTKTDTEEDTEKDTNPKTDPKTDTKADTKTDTKTDPEKDTEKDIEKDTNPKTDPKTDTKTEPEKDEIPSNSQQAEATVSLLMKKISAQLLTLMRDEVGGKKRAKTAEKAKAIDEIFLDKILSLVEENPDAPYASLQLPPAFDINNDKIINRRDADDLNDVHEICKIWSTANSCKQFYTL